MVRLFERLKAWFFYQGSPVKPKAVLVNQTDSGGRDDNGLVQEVVPYDENLLERSRTQWQFGDWASLAAISRETLQHHPDRAKLALLTAAGHQGLGNAAQARQYTRLAIDWGCSKKLVTQILISGVHNTLGRAVSFGGQQNKALKHFESAISIGTPGSDVGLITQARAIEQIRQTGLTTVALPLQVGIAGTATKGTNKLFFEKSLSLYQGEEEDYKKITCLASLEGARNTLDTKRLIYEKYLINEKNRDQKYESWPLVSIIMASCRPEKIENIINNIRGQKYPNKEVIVVIQNYTASEFNKLESMLTDMVPKLNRCQILVVNTKMSLGARQNLAINNANGTYWAKMDDDDWYFENYLTDMIITIRLGDYDLVGKNSVFVYLDGKDLTLIRNPNMQNIDNSNLRGASFVAKNKFSNDLFFGDLQQGEDSELLKKAREAKLKIHATDPFNFIVYRSSSVDNHTWKKNQSYFLETSNILGSGFLDNLVKH